jgi:hypothetical protein
MSFVPFNTLSQIKTGYFYTKGLLFVKVFLKASSPSTDKTKKKKMSHHESAKGRKHEKYNNSCLPILCFVLIIHHLTESSPRPDIPCAHLSSLDLLFPANVRTADQPLPVRPEEVFCLSSLDIFGYQPLQPVH